jgi:hypothetical protein
VRDQLVPNFKSQDSILREKIKEGDVMETHFVFSF